MVDLSVTYFNGFKVKSVKHYMVYSCCCIPPKIRDIVRGAGGGGALLKPSKSVNLTEKSVRSFGYGRFLYELKVSKLGSTPSK